MKKLILASMCIAGAASVSGCATVSLGGEAEATVSEATPTQSTLRSTAKGYAARVVSSSWAPEGMKSGEAARRAFSVLLKGWGAAEPAPEPVGPAETYLADVSGRAEDAQKSLDYVIADDIVNARTGLGEVTDAGRAVLAVPPSDLTSLGEDVTALETAMAAARRAHGVFSEAVRLTGLTRDSAVRDQLAAFDSAILDVASVADALNETRTSPTIG